MTPLDNHNTADEQLVARILRGEKNLLDVLFDRYIEKLLRYVLLFVRNREEAKDVAQEIFIKVFRSLEQYRFMGRFERWFFTIARHALIDQHRKRKLATFSFDSVGMDESSIPDPKLPENNAPELLQGLPVRDREILQLRFIENLSYEEIAEITGMTQGSLRNVVHRSIRRLQEDNSDELPKNQGMA